MNQTREHVISLRLEADEHQLTAHLATNPKTQEKHLQLAKEFREIADVVEGDLSWQK